MTRGVLEIGDTSADGCLQIVDTNRDADNAPPSRKLRVTVRELIGGYSSWTLAPAVIDKRMGRLARRAVEFTPTHTHIVGRHFSQGCQYVTFLVTR